MLREGRLQSNLGLILVGLLSVGGTLDVLVKLQKLSHAGIRAQLKCRRLKVKLGEHAGQAVLFDTIFARALLQNDATQPMNLPYLVACQKGEQGGHHHALRLHKSLYIELFFQFGF